MSPLFRRRHEDEPPNLRGQILHAAPDDLGFFASEEHPVWGAVMDMAFPGGVATLVSLEDGTTSLYTSTGGGVIGGGGVAQIQANLPAILAALRDAAGPGVPIVGMSYYDPFLPVVSMATQRVAGAAFFDFVGRCLTRLMSMWSLNAGDVFGSASSATPTTSLEASSSAAKLCRRMGNLSSPCAFMILTAF